MMNVLSARIEKYHSFAFNVQKKTKKNKKQKQQQNKNKFPQFENCSLMPR